MQIRFNLVLAIAIAQITFLAGINASETEVTKITFFYCLLVLFFFICHVRSELSILLDPLKPTFTERKQKENK